GAEGQIVDRTHHQVVANVIDAGAAVAHAAVGVLGRIGLTAADRAVVDGVRPHVVGGEQPATGEVPLQGDLEGVEGAVAVVVLDVHRSHPGELASADSGLPL